MKYHIPGIYYRDDNNPIVDAWDKQRLKVDEKLDFVKWLKETTGCYKTVGNWEDGWTLQFDDESKYIWFLLKWAA